MNTTQAEALQRGQLRERFRNVILSAGYTSEAAEGILTRWFAEYMKDVAKFMEMLRDYEEADRDPE